MSENSDRLPDRDLDRFTRLPRESPQSTAGILRSCDRIIGESQGQKSRNVREEEIPLFLMLSFPNSPIKHRGLCHLNTTIV
jgi:hypothetical protein